MIFSRTGTFLAIAVLLAIPWGPASAKGLISASYTLNWTQDVLKKVDTTDSRTFKQVLDTKYTGFLSPIIQNEISFKVDYEKSSSTASKIRLYPTITLAYKGSYWNAGSKRTITREPATPQKVTDSHFIELFYMPARFGMPDLKAKYTADLDTQTGTTEKFRQSVALSSAYEPVQWFNIKGDYSWSKDDERFRKEPVDTGLTPVSLDEKYSITAGARHFFSEKLKFNSEWKSEFSRGGTYFDNGFVKDDSVKQDQNHTLKNTLAFRPFDGTAIDATYDYGLKQTMVPKIDSDLVSRQEHTINYNSAFRITQKIGTPIEVRGEFTRAKTDVRHTILPSISIDDGWSLETKGSFAKQLQLNARYTRHNILTDGPTFVPKRTGTIARAATWTGELLPFWKPSASYDETSTYDDTIARGRFLKSTETKYGLKGPLDFKLVALNIDPTYDINTKRDYTNLNPAAREVITSRDLKIRIAKMLLQTRTIEVKVDHSYGRKEETGHIDGTLNNITRSDSSTGNMSIKDIVPDYTGGFDFSRSANDTSGDALGPDVTENFGLKIDYKHAGFGWNASYKYDRNLRLDKDNKWTFDWKASWTAEKWDASLTYSQSTTLSVLRDESYKVAVDFKYNF